jgi:hypothetical protein
MTIRAWVELTNQYRQALQRREIKPKPSPEEILSALEAIWALLMTISLMSFWTVSAGAKLRGLAEVAGAIFDYAAQSARVEQMNKARAKAKANPNGQDDLFSASKTNQQTRRASR